VVYLNIFLIYKDFQKRELTFPPIIILGFRYPKRNLYIKKGYVFIKTFKGLL